MADNDNRPEGDEPRGRPLPDDEPRITTQSDSGEPEKRFGRPGPEVIREGDDDDTPEEEPEERDLPDEAPRITTLTSEPEKRFTSPSGPGLR